MLMPLDERQQQGGSNRKTAHFRVKWCICICIFVCISVCLCASLSLWIVKAAFPLPQSISPGWHYVVPELFTQIQLQSFVNLPIGSEPNWWWLKVNNKAGERVVWILQILFAKHTSLFKPKEFGPRDGSHIYQNILTHLPLLRASWSCFRHRSIFLSLTWDPYLEDE